MRDHVLLFINGRRYDIAYEQSVVTLADFVRRQGLVGTKIVCNEGDCGACSVLVGRPTSDARRLQYHAIDSCIQFLYQLDRTHVVTVEGLRKDDALTPIQDAMVRCHGSQCGFCTPGFVVTMHGMVEEATTLDDESLRYGLSGNLCRCTGYKQILDAGVSVDPKRVPRLSTLYSERAILDEISSVEEDAVCLAGEQTIFLPRSIEQAVEFKATNPAATIVSGATDHGVLFNHRRTVPSDILCLTNLQGYDVVRIENQLLSIGGGATWTAIERFIEKQGIFPQYHSIITRFGSPQIRNTGTLAGNLATGSPIADSIPFHLVMDSQLRLVSARGERQVGLNDFYTGYRQNVMADDELIAEITTPLLGPTEQLSLYKISKRRDMDISTLTLAVWINVTGDTIDDARLAIGGVGPTVLRMAESETHLIGQKLTENVFHQAGVIARSQITPWSDVRGGDDFRLQLTENLLVKAYRQWNDQLSMSNVS